MRFRTGDVVLAWLGASDDSDDGGWWLLATVKRVNVQGHAYQVDFKATHLEAAELPPDERRRLIEDDKWVMAHSLESMVKHATLSIVFDEDRRLAISSTVFRSRYRELIGLAVAAGNAYSFEWLCDRASLLPMSCARVDLHEVLLDAVRQGQFGIIQSLVRTMDGVSAFSDICEKDSTRRHSIFDVVAREGHAELLFDMASLRFNNEWGNSNIGKDLVFNMCCTRSPSTPLHIAAERGHVGIFHSLYQLMTECELEHRLRIVESALPRETPFEAVFCNRRDEAGRSIYDLCESHPSQASELVAAVEAIRVHVTSALKNVHLKKAFRWGRARYNEEDLNDAHFAEIARTVRRQKGQEGQEGILSVEAFLRSVLLQKEHCQALFWDSLVQGHLNTAKLLVLLGVADPAAVGAVGQAEEAGAVGAVGAVGAGGAVEGEDMSLSAVERACVGSWWQLTQESRCYSKRPHESEDSEEVVCEQHMQWDNRVRWIKNWSVPGWNRHGCSAHSFQAEMDLGRKRGDTPDDGLRKQFFSVDHGDMHTDDIGCRGSVPVVQWLLRDTSVPAPSCAFVVRRCDRHMCKWYLGYRLAVSSILQTRPVSLTTDLARRVLSFIYPDPDVSVEQMVRLVVTAPTAHNNEKSLYLLDWLLKEGADPFLRALPNSESALHLAIGSSHLLCAMRLMFSSPRRVAVIDRSNCGLNTALLLHESGAMLPLSYALTCGEDEVIDQVVEALDCHRWAEYPYSSAIEYDAHLDGRWCMVDSQGRTLRSFAAASPSRKYRSAVCDDNYVREVYATLRAKVDAGCSVEELQTHSLSIGGLKLPSEQGSCWSRYFGGSHEQQLLFSCIVRGRLDVLDWYRDAHMGWYDTDNVLTSIWRWRFNSEDVHALDGRGVFHAQRHCFQSSWLDDLAFAGFMDEQWKKEVEDAKQREEQGGGQGEGAGQIKPSEAFYSTGFSVVQLCRTHHQRAMAQEVDRRERRQGEKRSVAGMYRNPAWGEANKLFCDALLCGADTAQVEALLQQGTSRFKAFAASLEFEESRTEVVEGRASSFGAYRYTVNPSHLYARPEMIELAIALSLDVQVFWMLDRMPPDYERRHDVIMRSLLQAIEHGNMPLFLQLLDRGAAEGVDINTVAVDTAGDFWSKRSSGFVSDQGGRPLSLVCAAAMEFEIFRHLYEQPHAVKPPTHSVLGEAVAQMYHGGRGRHDWYFDRELLPSDALIIQQLDKHYQQGRSRKQQNRLHFLAHFNQGLLHSVPDILTVFESLCRGFSRTQRNKGVVDVLGVPGDLDVLYPEGFSALVVAALRISLQDNHEYKNHGICVNELVEVRTRQEQELQLCIAVKEGASVEELERHLVKEFTVRDLAGGMGEESGVRVVRESVVSPATVLRRSDGMPLLHFASLLQHTHIMRWLVLQQGCELEGRDSKGRTAEDVARAMKRVLALQELQHIAGVLRERRQWEERLHHSALRVQCAVRGRCAVRQVRQCREELGAAPLYGEWAAVVAAVFRQEMRTSQHLQCQDRHSMRASGAGASAAARITGAAEVLRSSWVDMKTAAKFTVRKEEEEGDEDFGAAEGLAEEMGGLGLGTDVDGDGNADEDEDGSVGLPPVPSAILPAVPSAEVKLTESALRWLRRMGSSPLGEAFHRRLGQLASGDRSYCLSKPLKAPRLSSCAVGGVLYETKLDKGQRILWTQEPRQGYGGQGGHGGPGSTGVQGRGQEGGALLVWFVAKHDHVPRCVALVEESFRRGGVLQCQRTPGTGAGASAGVVVGGVWSEEGGRESRECEQTQYIMVDPRSNNILKTFSVPVPQLPRLRDVSWTPPLTLTAEEAGVVEQPGSVLLLGRSGTGKTLCLVSRMTRDRLLHAYAYSAGAGVGAGVDMGTDKGRGLGNGHGGPRQLFVCCTKRLCAYVSSLYSEQLVESTHRDTDTDARDAKDAKDAKDAGEQGSASTAPKFTRIGNLVTELWAAYSGPVADPDSGPGLGPDPDPGVPRLSFPPNRCYNMH
ncbi:hypothetical protein B484DRAFT_293969 [Ochromonadaceae sp. CCMP2298]|nr:hypothetical protein B484DRAFT_293969 [Ochromonadaceae sp. CCMP2298]